ncbi:hypothetical protein [Chitinibacter sp. GC72]|uniref:hypothetical protein n=1 Tax=Chitinibacter sp. GC72 TaxID=1526917 RepID=UPI0012FC1110|nr:hypothetical protein [Chitinibacter sp. GC72]
MNWKKWLILTMSSVWFFPVSCSTSAIGIIKGSSYLGIQHHERGDPVPARFAIAVFNSTPAQFHFEKISVAASYPITALRPPHNYASRPHPSDAIGQLQVRRLEPPELIETTEFQDDYTFIYRYQLKASGIEPISSQTEGIGNALLAGLLCWPIGILIYELSNWLRRRFYS